MKKTEVLETITSYSKEKVLKELVRLHPSLKKEILGKAFDYCEQAHKNQVRKSGEPFIFHPVEVARYLAHQQMDTATVAAGLLHDVVEDSGISLGEIENEFGKDIAILVDGVTKIKEMQMINKNKEERKAETFRKILLSMAKDIRVIIIKFADRLHNLKTLRYLSKQQIENMSRETMDVYAPLAHRLGMASVKSEFEDLAFSYLHPEEYEGIITRMKDSRMEREEYIERILNPVRRELKGANLGGEVCGRPKHYYSIYRKMQQRGMSLDEIYDLFAVRIILDSVDKCYLALGVIHSLYTPLQVRFKDYIASPKSNLYQSLHTTVVGPNGKMVEFQIRTVEMHRTAEAGIAAHWNYKEGGKFSTSDEHMSWLRQIVEWQEELADSNEFLEFLKIDLFPADVFIFTPGGDVIQLPKGATALDFAFSIHTDLGVHCVGVKINGKMMPLDTVLQSGSTVEVLRAEEQQPTMEWMRYVRTSRAKSALRRWLNQEGKVRSRDLGKELLKREYEKLNLKISLEEWLKRAAKALKTDGVSPMLEKIGKGELSIYQVMHDLPAEDVGSRQTLSMRNLVNSLRLTSKKSAIRIEGDKNLMIRFARCCMPVPGEKIVGFITRGRGVAIHRIDCPNALMLAHETERRMDVEWNTKNKVYFKVRIEVIANNRNGLLAEQALAIAEYQANIANANILTRENMTHNIYILEILHLQQLKKIISALKKIKGVQKVVRGRMEESAPV